MKIVLIGATGVVGSKILIDLIEQESISQVITLSRKKINLESQKLISITNDDLMRIDYTNDIFSDVDFFISALGSTLKTAGSKDAFFNIDFNIPLSIATKLKEQGLKKIILISAMGASSTSPFFYNQVKGKLEEALTSIIGQQNIYIIRPSLLISRREEKRFVEQAFVSLYHYLENILPKKILNKLGTQISAISDEILSILNC